MNLYPAWLRHLLRLFFKLLYHQFAWSYDWVAATVSLGSWKKWVTSVIPFLDAQKILELGHGPGHLQAELLRQGRFCVGIDASPQMSRLASRNLTRQGLSPRLVTALGQQLPFPSGSFECLAATFPTEYIADPATLAEIHRVLTDGGKAVILLLAWITGKSPLHRALSWLYRFTGQTFEWDDRYLAPLRNAGFQPHSEVVSAENSTLLVIVLEKIPVQFPQNSPKLL
mgnify:CR=1 FL=1